MTSTRERIIEATLTLVADQGLAAVTMVGVARTAGVARATLYNHYPDVPTILADAVTTHNQHAVDGLRQALAVVSTPQQAVEQLVRYVGAISSSGHTLTTHDGFPPELHQQVAAFDIELEGQIDSVLTRGVLTGDFRSDLDVGVTVGLFRHALTGVSELVATNPEQAAHIVESAATTLLAAVVAQPEPS